MSIGARAAAAMHTPRRRSELGLLLMGALVIVFASLLPSLAATDALPDHEVTFLLGLFALALVVHVANRFLAPEADPVMLPVVLVMNGIGYVMIERLDPSGGGQQLAWTVIGVAFYVATLVIVKASRDLERYRFLMLFVAMALLVLPLLPKIGLNVNGARLWVHVGGLEFQPVEFAKILLVFFFASYFIEKRELFTLRTRRIGNHLFPDFRAFGPVLVAGVLALLVILGEHDIGFALLLFVVFLSLLFVTTGRWTYLVIGLALFALGTYLASHILSQLNERISVWLDPWADPSGTGYQPIQGLLAFGDGGLFGTGLGLGNPNLVPYATSDFIFSAIGEELGLFGAAAVIVGYVLIVGSGLRAALRARSEFAKLAATGLVATFGFQAFFIMAGVVRILPLTGVTLPFLSYGGSSLVANYVLVAILMRISDEGNQSEFAASNEAWSSTPVAAVTGTGRR